MEGNIVLQARVLFQLKHLARKGHEVVLVAYKETDNPDVRIKAQEFRENIKVHYTHRKNLLIRLISMVALSVKASRGAKYEWIYSPNIWGGLIVPFIKRMILCAREARFVFDIRGLVAEESLYKRSGSLNGYLRYAVLSYLMSWVCMRADKLVCVSEKFKTYLNKKYPDSEIHVIPSAVDSEVVHFDPSSRTEVKIALGIDDSRIVFVYSGSSSKWQMLRSTIELFKAVHARIPNCLMLILSRDVSIIKRLIQQAFKELSEVILIKSVPHAEIYKYLSAGDLAFLLREPHIINQVSSPVKFAEYLICGLPVITTNHVGDYSKLVTDEELGIVIDLKDNLTDIVFRFVQCYKQHKRQFNERCMHLAEASLTWQTQQKKLDVLFSDYTSHEGENT